MPYIVVKSNFQETDCRELTGAMVLGRSPECDFAIRDIALSRRHCRIELTEQGWSIVDLASKNGTNVNGEALGGTALLLKEGDIVRLGRSKIIFYEGILDEGMIERSAASIRPLDPHEALAGTVAGFTLLEAGETEKHENMPCPRPQPRGPVSLQGEELQELLTAIASSSWDSIYAEARQPAVMRPMPTGEERPRRRVARPRSPIDLSLQASSMIADEVHEAVEEIHAAVAEIQAIIQEHEEAVEAPAMVMPQSKVISPSNQSSRREGRKHGRQGWRASMQRHLGFAVVGGCMIVGLAWANFFWPQSARSPMSPRTVMAVPRAMPIPELPLKDVGIDPPAAPTPETTWVLLNTPFHAAKWRLHLTPENLQAVQGMAEAGICISMPISVW